MNLLQQEIEKSLEFPSNSRLQSLRADIGGLREQVQQWVERGTFRRPFALEKLREARRKIAQKHHEALQAEARQYRRQFEQAERDAREDIRRNPVAAQIRREEREFEALLSSDNELTSKLYAFTSANDPVEAATAFSSYDDLLAVFAEAQRRGLQSAVESFRKAWAEQPFKLSRTCFDQPSSITDLQRAMALESVPEDKLLLERRGDDGRIVGEYEVDISNVINEDVLDVLAD